MLVGTVSVEKSEKLSGILKKMGVRHEVLNAKNHEREAFIVAQAGRKGAVTVSTNMAGRGTDILLGGNAGVHRPSERLRKENKDPDACRLRRRNAERQEWDGVYSRFKARDRRRSTMKWWTLGGLHIVGTERHESRRIDNQLRGRAGRQGDPGSARFYLSLQDDLMRIFGGQRMQNLMLRLGMEEDVPIESKMITKRIAAAQKAVEAQNFASRKHILEYDDVMNKQRQAVYGMRRELLEGEDQKERVLEIIEGILGCVHRRCAARRKPIPSQCDWTGLETDILTQFGVKIRTEELQNLDRREMEGAIQRTVAQEIPGKRRPGRPRADARNRAHDHAQRHRQPVERPPAVDGPPEGRHRPARLRPERSADRIQEGILHPVPGHDGPHRRRNHPLPVLHAAQRRATPVRAAQNVPHPELWDDEEEEDGGEPEAVGVGGRSTQRAARSKPRRIP